MKASSTNRNPKTGRDECNYLAEAMSKPATPHSNAEIFACMLALNNEVKIRANLLEQALKIRQLKH